ncbi:hypothetical protein AB7M16_003333 [Bradyrhizobium sp. USDA 372]
MKEKFGVLQSSLGLLAGAWCHDGTRSLPRRGHLASLPYIPQVRKAWPRGPAGDLSSGMLSSLTMALILWMIYGFIRSDWVIVCANVVGGSPALFSHARCGIRDSSQRLVFRQSSLRWK